MLINDNKNSLRKGVLFDMRTHKIFKNFKNAVSVMLLMLVVAVLSIMPVCAADEAADVQAAETVITGVPSRITKDINAPVTIKVGVSPAGGGRTVRLQRYDSLNKKWRTAYTKTTKDADKASVGFSIDKKYRKRTTGKWRVYVAGSDQAGAAVSRTFKLTSRNIGDCSIGGKSACIYCVDTGEFIQSKNCNKKLAQASTTKLMTAILVIEKGRIDATAKISQKAASTPSSDGYLKAGDKYSNMDLVYAMMLPSANDAATALAEDVSGDTKKFVRLMNARAEKMGLKNTFYKNPHGLDANGHYSTARDVAVLTAEAYEHPQIRKTWMAKRKTITSKKYGVRWKLSNTDKILGYSDNFKGGKTGTQPKAGYCFTGVYKWKGKTYVTVVLGSKSEAGRWKDTKNLHRYIKKYAESKY